MLWTKIYIHSFNIFHISCISWDIGLPDLEYTSIHALYLLFQNTLNIFLNNSCSCISIIYMNIYIYTYIIYIFFSLLFLYDFKKIKTLNNLKILYRYNFVSLTTVFFFLSVSGIPPLMGFVGKFLLLNFLFFSQKYFYIIIFSLLNFFSLFFYVQNFRFLVSKTQTNYFLINGFYVFLNKNLINILVFLNYLNIFSILYLEDILYFFLNMVFFKNSP